MGLSISRKPGDHVYLALEDGREIDLMVVRIRRDDRVILYIDAPRTIRVYCDEHVAQQTSTPGEVVSSDNTVLQGKGDESRVPTGMSQS